MPNQDVRLDIEEEESIIGGKKKGNKLQQRLRKKYKKSMLKIIWLGSLEYWKQKMIY
ncbi:hypothetical protein JMUB3870_2205 [Leptotrichia trevisanii]|uniref:Uncharacterized protein n=1 Tax=Leptotrichia trevisanii TaxID=109328 RepID=A0A510K332_9FUSO|nr:hypothetical protein JMUB3870_2205 [Leptotrichia trevisanii]